MIVSERGMALIRAFEGLRLEAYRCPAGIWTIGYGHTGGDVKPGMRISAERARELLREDVGKFASEVSKALKEERFPALRQSQFDALVSVAYNMGLPRLRGTSLWRTVWRNPEDAAIQGCFARLVYGGGRRLPGLVRRRQAEATLYAQKP